MIFLKTSILELQPKGASLNDTTFEPAVIQINSKKKVTTRSARQTEYVNKIRDNRIIFGAGSSGTGKTFLACATALELLHLGETEKIWLTRPMVEAGDSVGTLPGTLAERSAPGYSVLFWTFQLLIGKEKFDSYLKQCVIEPLYISFGRGASLYDTVLCDEAQNMTAGQMKLLLTRIAGNKSKFIINGDYDQIDLRPKSNSGLFDAMERTEGIGGVASVEFGVEDVQRSQILKDIIKSYED